MSTCRTKSRQAFWREKGGEAFKLEGDLSISSVGVVSALSKSLADAGISVFGVSIYEINYILVEEKNLHKAIKTLSKFCEIKK